MIVKLQAAAGIPSVRLTLGLDIGIASLGWALLDLENKSFVAAGVRTWDAPEDNRKNLLNAKRREKRLLRRVIRHKARHLEKTRKLFRDKGLIQYADSNFLAKLTAAGDLLPGPASDPWRLRAAALDRLLTGPELAVALYHIANHRGYRDTSKAKSNQDSEGRVLLSALDASTDAFRLSGYRTVGEWYANDPAFAVRKRNSTDDYSHSVRREILRDEVREIFRAQQALGSKLVTDQLRESFDDLFFNQKPIPSQSSRVGECAFLPSQKRTTPFAPSFEYKRLLDRLHNLRFGEAGSKMDGALSHAQIRQAAAVALKKSKLTYKDIRKLLDIQSYLKFKGIKEDAEKNDVCVRSGKPFEGSRVIRQCIGDEHYRDLRTSNPEVLDAIAETVAFNDDLEAIRARLSDILDESLLEIVLASVKSGHFGEFKGTVSLSSEACRRLVASMENGMSPQEAMNANGFTSHEGTIVDLDSIGNPVVRKAIGETLKTVMEIVRAYGRPERIQVELARSLGKSAAERSQMESGMNKQSQRKEDQRSKLEGILKRPATAAELLKFALWEDQNERCPYTDTGIRIESLFDGSNVVQVDHILPLSRFHDNSYNNKVLVYTKANAEKGQRTPYEYITATGGEIAWKDFAARIEASSRLRGIKKRNFLLIDAAEKEEAFRSRNLNDTRYIAKAVLGVLGHLYPKDGRRHVFARQGSMTALMRQIWSLDDLKHGVDGKRVADSSHHAVDAMVVAATDEAALQRLSAAARASGRTGVEFILDRAQQPWEGFSEDVRNMVSEPMKGGRLLVSRERRAKASGPAHKDTIYGSRKADDGSITTYERKEVLDLKLEDLKRIPDPDRNARLIDGLREWLSVHPNPNDRKKAGQEPFVGPTGAVVRKLRLERVKSSGIDVRGGVATRATIVRLDVFKVDGKYLAIPIYLHQIAEKANYPEPPVPVGKNGAPVGNEHFVFSLYPKDLIYIENSKGVKIHAHYTSFDITNRRILFVSLDGKNDKAGVGGLKKLVKFNVDRIGRYVPIKKEKRTWRGAAFI